MSGGQDPATWDWEVSTSGRTQAEDEPSISAPALVPSEAGESLTSKNGCSMSFEQVLTDCLDDSLGPQVMEASGMATMGFPGIDDEVLRKLYVTIEAWLGDAVNAGLLPDKEQALSIVEYVFNAYISPRVGPIAGRLMLMGLKALVASIYDRKP